MIPPSVEERLAKWAAQSPRCVVSAAECAFIEAMRRARAGGVGYGWMRQVIWWEWEHESPDTCPWDDTR